MLVIRWFCFPGWWLAAPTSGHDSKVQIDLMSLGRSWRKLALSRKFNKYVEPILEALVGKVVSSKTTANIQLRLLVVVWKTCIVRLAPPMIGLLLLCLFSCNGGIVKSCKWCLAIYYAVSSLESHAVKMCHVSSVSGFLGLGFMAIFSFLQILRLKSNGFSGSLPLLLSLFGRITIVSLSGS
ncbi:hypothetical protein M8C21_018431 [Ambrosia artemisiifolia]|uniref:Uncharacterized protein n=1 Tax=Ambrosia artemisiifolia TaxID=4212 RepID=A0AAD5CFT4_AMBAR|nr:hypothetical protein M8C21_018431 [Ambrosia artemisiifolia]